MPQSFERRIRYLQSVLMLLATLTAISCTQAPQPASNPASDQQTCLSYGYAVGSAAYTACLAHEAEARRRGTLGPNYDQILVAPAPK
jgi:hypothetical protein